MINMLWQLFDMDGLNFKFIKEFWNILKEDFFKYCDEFHKKWDNS